MLITSARKRNKVSATLHLLILFRVLFLGALSGSILCSLFLIYIKSYSPLLNSLQPVINYFSLLNAKTLACKLNPDLKANLNKHPSVCHSIHR